MNKVILGAILFFQLGANAQKNYNKHASQLQVELFGPAGLFSLNIDSRFTKKENGIGFKIGLGGAPLGMFGETCNSGSQISLPAGLNYLFGKRKHFVEVGGGRVLVIIGATKRYCEGFESGFFSDETGPYGYASLGYRYQPFEKKGITFRTFVSPLFQQGFNTKIWGGGSIGYRW
jgi:hypothetical protein